MILMAALALFLGADQVVPVPAFPAVVVPPVEELTMVVVPLPLEVVRQRVGIRNPKFGLFNVHILNSSGVKVEIPRERLMVLIAEWCAVNRAPMPPLLTREQVWPVLARQAGGRWPLIRRILGYAGAGMALSGVPAGAVAGPAFDLLSQGAGQRIPDISALSAELPATVVIPAGGGVTLMSWSARMSTQPRVIGPLRFSR